MALINSGTAAGLIAGLVVIGGQAFGAGDGMDTIRTATAKYQDVNVALAEGFIPDPSGTLSLIHI